MEGCVWFFVIDEAARCIDVSCGDDDGVGKVKASRKVWRWSSRGRRGKGWKVGGKVDVEVDIMGRSLDTIHNAFVRVRLLMVKENYQRD